MRDALGYLRRLPYLGQIGVTQEWLDEREVWVLHVPYTEGISTTDIRGRW